ncbi:hypothetical protein [Absidia glauca]|uniref:Uncharacterized protein n=1 Tax=Absidia glauca TaxID=4829 RepID=A0A168Q3T3_ABSGL|nr:hypothetical protein [Absidia glauca]
MDDKELLNNALRLLTGLHLESKETNSKVNNIASRLDSMESLLLTLLARFPAPTPAPIPEDGTLEATVREVIPAPRSTNTESRELRRLLETTWTSFNTDNATTNERKGSLYGKAEGNDGSLPSFFILTLWSQSLWH